LKVSYEWYEHGYYLGTIYISLESVLSENAVSERVGVVRGEELSPQLLVDGRSDVLRLIFGDGQKRFLGFSGRDSESAGDNHEFLRVDGSISVGILESEHEISVKFLPFFILGTGPESDPFLSANLVVLVGISLGSEIVPDLQEGIAGVLVSWSSLGVASAFGNVLNSQFEVILLDGAILVDVKVRVEHVVQLSFPHFRNHLRKT